MDTGCTGHLFKDTSMLTNKRPAGNVTATGIFGTSHRVDGAGDFKTMGVVHHTTMATSNLISVTQLLDMGCTMSADRETMRMLGPSGREFIAARRGSSGMFEVSLKDIKAFPMSVAGDSGAGAPRLTSAEMLRARAARQLHVSAGHIADEALKQGLSGPYRATYVTARDVDNAALWLGPCLACVEANMMAPDQPAVEREPIRKPGHTLGCDLVELACPSIGGNRWMLIIGDYATGHPVVVPIQRKTTEMVCEGLQAGLAAFNQYGNRVERIVFDSEAVFRAVKVFLGGRGVLAVYTPAGLHNRWVERLIQTLKRKVRQLEAGMTFIMPEKLKVETWMAAAGSVSVTPNKLTGPHNTPLGVVSGLQPALRPYAHGAVGMCYSRREDSPDLRAEWCIYLDLEGNAEGHHRVFVPLSGREDIFAEEVRPDAREGTGSMGIRAQGGDDSGQRTQGRAGRRNPGGPGDESGTGGSDA